MSDFIVDACVLRSAGYGTNALSVKSREALNAIMETPCAVLVSEPLYEEWNRHASKMSALWMATLESSARLIHVSPPFHAEEVIRTAVAKIDQSNRICALKDIHLVLIASSFHGLIVSNELRSRSVFHSLVRFCDCLAEIFWVSCESGGRLARICDVSSKVPPRWSLCYD
jgi:hypothetical protein